MKAEGLATAALVVIGIFLVVIGLLAGGSVEYTALGVGAIALGAILETWVRTRR